MLASRSLSPNLSDAPGTPESRRPSPAPSPSPSISDESSPATQPKTNTKASELWTASSRGNEHIKNSPRCPRRVYARNATCRGTPCQQCKRLGYNADECQSKKMPSKLNTEKKHLKKRGLDKKGGGGSGIGRGGFAGEIVA